jgi:hypothetical protein
VPPASRSRHTRTRVLPIRKVAVSATLLLLTQPVLAQHGMDFLLAESPRLPQPGGGYLYVRQDYLSMDRNLYQVEPGVLFGLSRRVAVSVPARMEKPQGRSARYAVHGAGHALSPDQPTPAPVRGAFDPLRDRTSAGRP